MDTALNRDQLPAGVATAAVPPFELLSPADAFGPVVYASPHSGDYYPSDFIEAARIDLATLRCSEDSHVDELFVSALEHGAPLLKACYGRAYLDPNREPWELDPAMFQTPLPAHVNTTSLRVIGGLGTIPKIVSDGVEIYRDKLAFDEAESRVRRLYYPYHQALQQLLREATDRHRFCLLVDCHSMPSIGGPMDRDAGARRADIVLGDRFSTTCAPQITELAQTVLSEAGFKVSRNVPYAGGFTTYDYGRPGNGVHTLQIEVNRAIYMDEVSYEKSAGFAEVRDRLSELVCAFSKLDRKALSADF